MPIKKLSAYFSGMAVIALLPLSVVTKQTSAIAGTIGTSSCPITATVAAPTDPQTVIDSFLNDTCTAITEPAGTTFYRYYSDTYPSGQPIPPGISAGRFLTTDQFNNSYDAIAQLALNPSITPNTAKYEEKVTFLAPITVYQGIAGPQPITGSTEYPGGAVQYFISGTDAFGSNITYTYFQTLATPEPSIILGAIAFLAIGIGIKRKLS